MPFRACAAEALGRAAGRPAGRFGGVKAIADGERDFSAGDLLHPFDEITVESVAGAHDAENFAVLDLFGGAEVRAAAALLDAIVRKIAGTLKQPLNVLRERRTIAEHRRIVDAKKYPALGVEDFDEIDLHRPDQWKQLLKERRAIVALQRLADTRH